MRKRVSVVIPAYNEEKTIVHIVKEVLGLKRFFPVEVIVPEGGSKDNTALLARRSGARVISFSRRRGKGADFWAGVKLAKGDYVIQIDADYQFKPKEIPRIVDALEKGTDIALGTRKSHRGALLTRTIGNFAISLLVSLLVGKRIPDALAGFKGFKRKALLAMDLKEPHFGYEVETIIKGHRLGFKMATVSVSYKGKANRASHVNVLKDGIRIIFSAFRAWHSPLKNLKERK